MGELIHIWQPKEDEGTEDTTDLDEGMESERHWLNEGN